MLEIDLQVSLVNIWSNNILFVVNITWFLDSLFSVFVLDDWLSSNVFSIVNIVFSINESNREIFLFNNWLNDWLINVFVRRKLNILNIDVVFNLNWFVNWSQDFFIFTSLFNLKLFSDFINSWFNDILNMSNIAWNIYVSDSLFSRVFGWKNSSISVNYLIILLNELRNQLFDLLVDSWSNNDSLSSWFDYLISNNFRFSDNSFGDDLWIS